MKRILVALDASPRAAAVLAGAADLAQRTGASLVLFRAIGLPRDVPPEAYTRSPAEVADMLVKSAETELQRMRAAHPEAPVERIATHVGTPWAAICQAAKDFDVDLVVIGSHGYDALDRLIGTTAAKVVNHADRSVLVVRNH